MDEGRYDRMETYCDMLGHRVPFSYCRKPGCDTPCPRAGGCWRGRFPVEKYLAKLPAEGPDRKKSRLDLILQAVELAKGR